MIPPDELLTARELSARLSVPLPQVMQWVLRGQLASRGVSRQREGTRGLVSVYALTVATRLAAEYRAKLGAGS